MVESTERFALGLDLGTTYSCIGVYRNGGVEIIPNRNGEKTTPSIVTILDSNKVLKGEETLNYLVQDYDSSIYAIKRFIGRKYNDREVLNEITKENFPFKITADEKGMYPLVLIDKNNKKIKFTLEEISSFIIRKMVDNAEAYLNKKVTKLVITVPANFNNAQRKSTKLAANLAGIEVLRIINEPTAASLAYGFISSENQALTEKQKNILVFDLGGGTFDVTILKIVTGSKQSYDILATKGDKFLGGEDFDNKLVEYFLDKFCKKMNEKKEEIKKDKKCIKKLKISCEHIKRVLSRSFETMLFVNNFYNGNDIFEEITRETFENICSDLFKRLIEPIEEALTDAKLKKDEIDEIILVGGSSRIPKIKTILQDYFNIRTDKDGKIIKNQKTNINDSINPDEAVAYGATLMAAEILIKKDYKFPEFTLMDITPLSLGVSVKNNSLNPEIQKEGNLMSVIIKRGSKIPFTNIQNYETAEDYQTTVDVIVFEGENKFIKYNHRLDIAQLTNLPRKRKGEVKIDVKFFIDVNGILTVTATEKDTNKKVEITIKNDNVWLTDEDIARIKEKNKALYEKANLKENHNIDYSNIKENLKEYQDAYKEAEEEDKYNILLNYNTTLEEFIDLFSINFDNEALVEKYYIYVNELFQSYTKVLSMKELTKEDKLKIVAKINEYIKVFTQHNSGYLDNLIETINELKEKNKKVFYEIIVNTIEQLNKCGKQCLEEFKKFCKYKSLVYFEKAASYFTKYIVDTKKLLACDRAVSEKCKKEKNVSLSYISDISSGAFLLCENSLNEDKLIESNMTGFTNSLYGLKLDTYDEQEKYQIVLSNYEKVLIKLGDEMTIKKALCIANIIKIGIKLLGDTNFKKYYKLGETCKFIVEKENIDKNKKWYREFEKLFNEMKDDYDMMKQKEEEMKKKIKAKYKNEFDKIDAKYSKKKDNLDFIKYILQLKPYEGYEEDIKNKNSKINFNIDSLELVRHLMLKYHPDNYDYSDEDEESQLNYCIIEYIDSYLNKIYNNIQ